MVQGVAHSWCDSRRHGRRRRNLRKLWDDNRWKPSPGNEQQCVPDGIKFSSEEVVPELPGPRAGNPENREESQEDPEDLLDEKVWHIQGVVVPELAARPRARNQ
jgi:hypothetical protein